MTATSHIPTTLIIPGLNSSGPAHWQTWFEQQIEGAIRVVQSDWKRADLPQWTSRIRREISRRSGPILIVAHSFGALAAVQAAEDHRLRIAGALLVAPADPEKFGVTDVLPAGPLGFPAAVVASANDPWLSIERAAGLAATWGADLVNVGAAGHINADSGYGPWPGGLALLQGLQARPSEANHFNVADKDRETARKIDCYPPWRDRSGGLERGVDREVRSTIADGLRV